MGVSSGRAHWSARRAAGSIGLLWAIVAVALPGVARAEYGTYARAALVPVEAPLSTQLATTTTYSGNFKCSVPFATVQAAPSGLAVGNCLSGVHLHRQDKSSQYNGTYWDGGFVYGNFNGCGWIQVSYSDQVADGTFQECPVGSIGYRTDEFAIATNEGTTNRTDCRENATSHRCTDGTSVSVAYRCYAYANYRPWVAGQDPTDYVRYYDPPAVLKWRYIAKFTSKTSGRQWVMVDDPTRSDPPGGQGNWLFVARACLSPTTGSLPGQQPV
jgi:hypothetical protein